MELAERVHALSSLEESFERCASAVGEVVVLDGGLGCGKTALLETFAQRASKEGALYLGAAGSWAETNLPLGILDQLLRGIRFPTPAVDRIAGLLAEPPVTSPAAGAAPSPVGLPVLRGLSDAVRELAETQPVVIGVDDAHLVDPQSWYSLLHLIRRTTSARVLVVFAASLHTPRVRCLFDAEVMRLSNSHRVTLPPLSRRGVAAALAQRLDPETATALAPGWHEVSGGNPLLVMALVDDYLAAPAAESARGGAFDRAVLSCVHRGEPGLLELARAIAMLGEAAAPSMLARMLGTSGVEIEQGLAQLEAAGLRSPVRLCAQRLRTELLDGMPVEERQAAHRRAAELLHEAGAPAPLVAEHLAVAEEVAAWAAEVLRTAATQLLNQGQADVAVGYLRLAYRGQAGEPDRLLTLAALNRALWLTNPAATERSLPELAAAMLAGQLDHPNAEFVLGQLLWQSQTGPAVDLLRFVEANDDGGRRSDGSGAAGLRHLLPYTCPGVAGNPARDGAPTAPLASTDALYVRAVEALGAVLTGVQDGDVVADAEQVLRAMRQGESAAAPILIALAVMFYADRPDKAISWCDSFPGFAADYGVVSGAVLKLLRGAIRYRHGELPEAQACAEEALAALSPVGWGTAVAAPLAVLIGTATAMGSYDQARAYLKVPVPQAAFDTVCGPHYLSARGHLYLATGAFEAAVHDFRACGSLATGWGFDSPGFVSWRTDLAEAYLSLGQPGEARALVDEQLAMLRPGPSRVRGLSLRMLAATQEPALRVPILLDAVDSLQFCGDRLNAAYAMADLSRCHKTLGERRLAGTIARRATQLAERCGAVAVQRSLAPLVAGLEPGPVPASLDIEPAPPAVLSDAERKVAVLAASGHTNRQIANQLFITVSTVEQHLTRVYRKLAVRRADLLSRLRSDLADEAVPDQGGATGGSAALVTARRTSGR